MLFANLVLIDNPFEEIEVQDLEDVAPGLADHERLMFRDSCRQRGVQAVLKLIPKHQRGRYWQGGKTAPDWWEPKVFWKRWPLLLQELTLYSSLLQQTML